MFSGSKKKEPRYTRLCEAKASHSQRMGAEVSSSAIGGKNVEIKTDICIAVKHNKFY
jgi:hypothetical protein